ncbi:MAG: hypothetical protein A2X64_11325 [Ignavibacteria bacterium GWF2_33_9]|nr:MAG: hypothetical protein A2X64_11325 [Ignavibacteria bacterium GWF2_33_9]
MLITRLQISNLRNHSDTKLVPNANLNVFYGPNGSGKTTILEAVSIAGLTKTFTSSSDAALIQQGKKEYIVNAEALNHLDLPYKINIEYRLNQKKQIVNGNGENLLPKEVIGQIPLIYLSPDQKNITGGSPENRRDFVDRILSQSSRLYLDLLIKLRKVLKQRNALLSKFKQKEYFEASSYESWTNMFIELASQIVIRRAEFVNNFKDYFKSAYSEITNKSEEVELFYDANTIPNFDENKYSQEEIKEFYHKKAELRRTAELARGQTLFGPQKDEIRIQINKGIAREIASQGQHKSLLIALIFAEFEYLLDLKNEVPVVLLDDIFSELDDYRTSLVLEKVLSKETQTFITLTNPELIKINENFKEKITFFELKEGIVTKK